jgi:predicted nucleotide-binding protein
MLHFDSQKLKWLFLVLALLLPSEKILAEDTTEHPVPFLPCGRFRWRAGCPPMAKPISSGVGQALHPQPPAAGNPFPDKPKVVFVHGRNRELEGDVLLFLTRIGLDPVVLHEQANGGRTVLEKFEEEAAAIDFAIVLMTPDDIGGLVDGESPLRARQNVVLELGYFIGKLGKKRVCVMRLGDIEDPSDFSDVAYIRVDADVGDNWRAS